jgi:hypothetical protein
MMGDLGRMLVGFGLLIAAVGGTLWLFSLVPGGRLPGDILIRRRGFTFYFPVVTGLVVSIVLSLVAAVLARFFRR